MTNEPFQPAGQPAAPLAQGEACEQQLRAEGDARRRAEAALARHVKEASLRAERLCRLCSAQTLEEERERRRHYTVLHDEVGQLLAMVNLKLGGLRGRLEAPTDVAEVDATRTLCAEVIQRTRTLMYEISPPLLHELGLEAALEWLVEESHGEIPFTFEDDGLPKPVAEDFQVLLFQAVGKLISNITRHSRARRAGVRVLRCGACIRITVSDDGVGFDHPAKGARDGLEADEDGLGLFCIRERILALGGHFSLDSAPGKGTHALLLAPLKPMDASWKGDHR